MSQRRVLIPISFLTALGACVGPLQRSREAYARGDFLAARELLARVEPEEGADLREKVAGGIDYTVGYLLDQAAALARQRRYPPYREALAYLRAALAVMPAGYPRRSEAQRSVEALGTRMHAVRAERDTLVLELRAAAAARDFDRARTLLHQILEVLRSVGGDEPAPDEVLELARDALGAGLHPVAVELVDLADQVRREIRVQITDDMVEIARVAAALRYFNRLDAEEEDSRRGRRARGPEAVPVPSPEEQEARARLRRIHALWRAGDRLEALRTLDDAIAELETGKEDLVRQRQAWQPERERMIADFVERGEMALSREAVDEARTWYQRILVLDPTHEIARDRMRKLDKLQQLQNGD